MNALAGDRPLSDIELEERLAGKSLDRGITHRVLPLLRPVRKRGMRSSTVPARVSQSRSR